MRDAHEMRQAVGGSVPKQAEGDVGVQCTIFSASVYLDFSVAFFLFFKLSSCKMGTVSPTLQSCCGDHGHRSKLAVHGGM